MAILGEILEAIRDGKRSFRPASSHDHDMQVFQSTAKALVFARDQGFIDGCILHQESMSRNHWDDSIIIQGGLSHKGETYLTAPTLEAGIRQEEIVELRPNIGGIGLNVRALWRRLRGR